MQRNGNATHAATQTQVQPQAQQAYTVYHDFDGTATVTETVVHAIADVTGMDVTDADFALHDYVDPDSLNRIFASKHDGTPRSNGHVSFSVMGYRTTVYANGQVSIVPTEIRQHPGR